MEKALFKGCTSLPCWASHSEPWSGTTLAPGQLLDWHDPASTGSTRQLPGGKQPLPDRNPAVGLDSVGGSLKHSAPFALTAAHAFPSMVRVVHCRRSHTSFLVRGRAPLQPEQSRSRPGALSIPLGWAHSSAGEDRAWQPCSSWQGSRGCRSEDRSPNEYGTVKRR